MRTNPIARLFLCLATVSAGAGCGDSDAGRSLRSELSAKQTALTQAEQDLESLRQAMTESAAREQGLVGQIEELKITISQLEAEKFSLENQSKEREARLEEIEGEIETTHKRHRAEMEALRKEFEAYRGNYRLSLRRKAPGTKLTDLEYTGIIYKNPEVLLATPAAIDIRHESGIARLDFAHLSAELRDRFGYHPGEAEEYKKLHQEKEVDNLVTKLSADDREDDFETLTNLRITYKAWQNKLARADGRIQRKAADIEATKRQLAKTRAGSFNTKRLQNDIERLGRDLQFLQRDRRELAIQEPFNPDAE